MGKIPRGRPKKGKLYTPTEIGRLLSPSIRADKVNLILQDLQWQFWEADKGIWSPTQRGIAMGANILVSKLGVRKTKGIRWPISIVEKIQNSYEFRAMSMG